MPVAKPRRSDTASGFTFINVVHPDEICQKATQRAIRSGAMAATGRARRKRPEKPVVIELEMLQTVGSDGGAEGGVGTNASTTVCLARALPFCQGVPPALPHLGIFAVEPDNRARELLHFMSGEAGYIYRPFRVEWFGMAILDPASYYLCLANAALFMDQRLTCRTSLEYTDTVESTKYYSKCLTQVTKQLTSPVQSISEGVITTVLGFVCHSFSLGNWDRCEMHMEGFERIIRLRGGFQGLSGFLPLFASWFDIANSAVQDTPPRFSSLLGDGPTEEIAPILTRLLARLENTGFDLTPLGESLRKTARLTNYINKHAQEPQFWKAGVISTRLIGPAAHCILSIPRLDIRRYSDDSGSCSTLLLQETVRLVLNILMASLKKAFSLVADELSLFLERFSILAPLMVSLSFFPELRLWACLVDSCAREGLIPPFHMSEIRRAMRDLQIRNSEDAVTVAKSIVWVDHLLDPQIERVKVQIDYHSTTCARPS